MKKASLSVGRGQAASRSRALPGALLEAHTRGRLEAMPCHSYIGPKKRNATRSAIGSRSPPSACLFCFRGAPALGRTVRRGGGEAVTQDAKNIAVGGDCNLASQAVQRCHDGQAKCARGAKIGISIFSRC
jgi:hypothetical protein